MVVGVRWCIAPFIVLLMLLAPIEAFARCVDINNASVQELRQIIHIDEVRAPKVVSHRPYTSVDQVTRVKGIGPARLRDIRSQELTCVL